MQNQFSYIDKEFKLTTVNRQNSFYYRITKPIEVWGNYHAQIAFFDRHNEIVYHRQTCFAHVLSGDNSMQFVKWSDNGEAVLFYEYRRGHIEHEGVYYYLFVDLKEKVRDYEKLLKSIDKQTVMKVTKKLIFDFHKKPNSDELFKNQE